MQEILREMTEMSQQLNSKEVSIYIDHLSLHLSSKKPSEIEIIGLGAGRMGYSLRSFIMRLSHMGFNASMIGDTNVPRVTKDSIVFVNSSSGETPTILLYAQQASAVNPMIFSTTCNIESSIGLISDFCITMPTVSSKQLMKSPYEQFSMLLYDYIIIKLMGSLNLDPSKVSANHSILE